MRYLLIVSLAMAGLFYNCEPTTNSETTNMKENDPTGLEIQEAIYGKIDDQDVRLFSLTNQNGMLLKVINYGGIVTELHVPDKAGKLVDITHGFDSLAPYQGKHPNFGALIGRYGNRIAKGKFSIDDQEYSLALNNGPNNLHGGIDGFSRRIWDAKPLETQDYVGVEFSRTSTDMEEGFPGNLEVKVQYLLNNDNEWIINYEATTDKKTIVNLTQHAYFNLKGHNQGDILDHELMIKADSITPVDATLIPTGEIQAVQGTPFDFNTPKKIGAQVDEVSDQQIEFGKGYDHNFVLTRKSSDELELAATVYEATTGRFMEVLTTEPGVQFYCGNFMEGKNIGKGGIAYQKRSGLCLETQHYPDSPNQANFPSTLLAPGEKYTTTTVYRFSTK